MRPVCVCSPAPREVWRELLTADRHALPSQTPEWVDCVCASGRWEDASRLYERTGGRLMVLPMVRRWYRPAELAASLPAGWGAGGLVAADAPTVDDVEAVVSDLAATRPLRLLIRAGPLSADAWAGARVPWSAVIPFRVHVLDLEGGFDRVWSARFTAETRKGLRKAERRAEQARVTFERGSGPNHVAAFYEVYLRWLDQRARDRGIPIVLSRFRGQFAEPRRKLELVAEALGDNCQIDIARVDGRPVAVNFALRQGLNVVSWRGFTDKDAGARLRLMELLWQTSIRAACEAGCQWYVMGESGGIRSLERFKERMGGRPRVGANYRLERLPISRLEHRMDAARQQLEQLLVGRHRRRGSGA